MKNIKLFWLGFLISISVAAQRNIMPSDTLRITGQIKQELIFRFSDFDTCKIHPIDDIILTNQHGEVKGNLKGLKGVLLKDILASAIIEVDKPKFLNEFYFVCIATDGYKAVFSWNEIFNSDIGNGIFIITEMDGKKAKDINDRIILTSTKDINSGRRHIKGLEKIIVRRAVN